MNVSRRNFLQSSAMTVTALGVAITSPVSFCEESKKLPYHVARVKSAWSEAGLGSEIAFLHKKGLLSLTADITSASQEDFLNGKMLDVDGLKLSQSESAFLIFMHSKHV